MNITKQAIEAAEKEILNTASFSVPIGNFVQLAIDEAKMDLRKAIVKHSGEDIDPHCGSTDDAFAEWVFRMLAESRPAHRHHKDAPDGFPCSCGKPVDDPIHLPIIEP